MVGTAMRSCLLLVLCFTLRHLDQTEATCRDSADCAPEGCCTVANMPYPTPTCNPFRKEGEFCKPSNKPFNTTTHAPDGTFWYNATNIYSNLCPCSPGLFCSAGICKKP